MSTLKRFFLKYQADLVFMVTLRRNLVGPSHPLVEETALTIYSRSFRPKDRDRSANRYYRDAIGFTNI